MHSYFLSASALFICMCESGCSPVCMVRQCVYLFMSSVWVLSVHHPTVSAETELAVKTGMKLWWRKKKKKKKPQQLWDISILAPRFPQAACRRLQNGCTPCHRVGSALSKCLWMENTRLQSFLPSSSPPVVLLSFPSACLIPFCPSFITHRKGISSSPERLSLTAAFTQRKTGSSSPLLEPCQSSLSQRGKVSASHSEALFFFLS